MTVHSPRVWWATIALLLWTQSAHCRSFTNDDIRDAILALVHTMQSSEQKLDRHEYREKSHREQIKKMLSGLEEKHKTLEPLNGIITRLDERLTHVENILLQKEEREKKIDEELKGIEKNLQTLTNTITQAITKESTDIDNNLTTSDSIDRRLDTTDAKIDAVKIQIENIKISLTKDRIRATCLDLVDEMNPLKMHISNADKLLSKYELKLNEYNTTVSKAQTDSKSLDNFNKAWHNNMTEVLVHQEEDIKKIQQLLSDVESMWKDLPRRADLHIATNQTLHAIVNATESIKNNDEKLLVHQEEDIKKIKQLLSDAESMWKDLPRRADLHLATNQTLHAIVNATENIKNSDEKSVGKVTIKLGEISDQLVTANKYIQNITLGTNMSEALGNISRSYDTLRTEVQKCTKHEHILLETLENVNTTKNSVESGVHKILTEMEDLIKAQSKDMNTTVQERFDNIESTIASNQSASVSNLTAKIESEMSSVWRQMSVMHQQLTNNKGKLDSLKAIIQGLITTNSKSIKNVRDEVGAITNKIVKLGNDMNSSLDTLSATTDLYHSELTTALDDLKKSSMLPVKCLATDSKPIEPDQVFPKLGEATFG